MQSGLSTSALAYLTLVVTGYQNSRTLVFREAPSLVLFGHPKSLTYSGTGQLPRCDSHSI